MADELPEWPSAGDGEETDASLTDQVTDFLQDRFNRRDRDLGPQVVGDWLLVAECVTADGARGLRILDSDLPLWRKLGLLEFLKQDAQTEAVMSNILDDEEDA